MGMHVHRLPTFIDTLSIYVEAGLRKDLCCPRKPKSAIQVDLSLDFLLFSYAVFCCCFFLILFYKGARKRMPAK